MSEFEKRRLAAIEAIRIAFRDVKREDGITLHEAAVVDDWGSAEEQAEARKLDIEGSWMTVPDGDIENNGCSLSYFDEKSFRYYIPAYMTWTLSHLESDSWSSDATIYSLYLHPELGDYQLSKFSLLNQEQRSAVVQFLTFMSQYIQCDHVIAKKALVDYWEQLKKEI